MKKFLAALVAWTSLIGASPVAAQKYTLGQWEVNKDLANIQLAITRTGDYQALVFCVISANGCEAAVNLGVQCDEGEKYPLLINSSVGAFHMNGTCEKFGTSKVLTLDNFDSAVSAFESGGDVGFVAPMASGQFRVVRFSTAGGAAAIKAARSLPEPRRSSQPSRTNRRVETL